jgi:hypothetical protein
LLKYVARISGKGCNQSFVQWKTPCIVIDFADEYPWLDHVP